MSQEENKKFIKRFVNEVLNKHNLDVLKDFVAEDYVEEEPMPDQEPTRDGLKTGLNRMFKGFPDIHWTIDAQYAEGDHVISLFTWTGTHKGEFMGNAATGKQVKVKGAAFEYIKGGKMTRGRIIADRLGLMQQIGVIPMPSRATHR